MKRAIVIQFNDGTPDQELEIAKATAIRTSKEAIYLEKMPSGKWRLTYSESIISDFSKVDNFKIFRED